MPNRFLLRMIIFLIMLTYTSLNGQKLVWVVDTIATRWGRGEDKVLLSNENGVFSYHYDTGTLDECHSLWQVCRSVGCDDELFTKAEGQNSCNSNFFSDPQEKRYIDDCYDNRLGIFTYQDSTYLYELENGDCHFLGKNVNAQVNNDRYIVLTDKETLDISIYFIEEQKRVNFPIDDWHVFVNSHNRHLLLYTVPDREDGLKDTYGLYDLDFNLIFSTFHDGNRSRFEYRLNADFICFYGSSFPLRAFYQGQELDLASKNIRKVYTGLSLNFCVIETNDGKIGTMTLDGKIIIPPSYIYVHSDSFVTAKKPVRRRARNNNQTLLTKAGHAILLNNDGRIIMEGAYNHINRIDTNRFVVYIGNEFGVVDSLGQEVIAIADYGEAVFQSHDYYGVKFMSLKSGFGKPGDNYSLFDMSGVKFADWVVETESPRVNSSEFYFRLTLKFLQSLSEDQVKKISTTDVWDVYKMVNGKNTYCFVDHTGRELLCGFRYVIKLNDSNHWLVESQGKKYGLLKVEH